MHYARIFFVGVCAAMLCPPLMAGSEYPLGAGAVGFGVDGTVDAARGLSGTGAARESLFGTALGYATWTQTRDAAAPGVAWSAYASLLWVEGRGPTERIVGDFLAVDNAEAYQSARLYSWWTEAAGEVWSVRAGALLADEEFAGTVPGGELINSGFGWPAFISANTLNTGPAYYVPALGARLAVTLPSGWSAKFGVYDGDSFDSALGDDRPNRHGTHYQLDAEQGAFFIAEVAYAPEGAFTRVKVGGWRHTADFADLGTGQLHAGAYGAYAIAERTLAGKTGESGNIEAHVRYGWAPSDLGTVAWAVDGAVAATGLIAARPADVTALGYIHAQISGKLAGQDHEQVTELSHAFVLGEHLTLQPDLQYIRHPGATGANADAWLFMLRLKASY